MVTYGIMLCFGKKTEKAEEFYNVLQEGGQEAHTFITANDKDLHPHFRKMCHLVTIHLFQFAEDFCGQENLYADYMDALKEADETVREDMWLD